MVDRCICCSVPFAHALDVARANGARTVAELQRVLEISTGCGLCLGYMQRVLETGQPQQPVMRGTELRHWRERSGCAEKCGGTS